MKVIELEVGKFYKCQLSKREMLVMETYKSGEPDKNGKPTLVKIIAGKYVDEVQGNPQFKLDELADGQLEVILKK